MSYHIIVKHLLMLCCVLRGLGASRGSMVPKRDSKITKHINQSQPSSYHKEGMAQFLRNSEVFLVPASDIVGRSIARQNLE